jgi:hypothetical protein
VLKEKHKIRERIPFPLILKGENHIHRESCRHGENYLYASWTMWFIAKLSSMTKGEIVGINVNDVKGLMLSLMSYYNFANTHIISKIDIYMYIVLQVY